MTMRSMAGAALQTPARDLEQQIRQDVQRALEAQGVSQKGVIVTPPAPPRLDPKVIELLQGQIAVEQATMDGLTKQLTGGVTDARERVLTSQIEQSQERLSSLQARLDEAMSQGTPRPLPVAGTRQPDPREIAEMFASRAENVAYGFFLMVAVVAIGVPLVRAFARWLDRRGQVAPAPQANLEPRLERIEQAVEAIAIEIERVSEGQRFTNKLMSEARALPAPNPLEQWPPVAEKQAQRAK